MGGRSDDTGAHGDGSDHEARKDKVIKELEVIRNRRNGGSGRSLLANKENFVLVAGLLYTVLYALMIFSMSAGVLGESTALDHAASKTFLDIGGECEEITDEPWIHMFPNEETHAFSLWGHNLPEGHASLTYTLETTDEDTAAWSETNASVKTVKMKGTSGTGRAYWEASYADLNEGRYDLTFDIEVYNQSDIAN
ncbi:MAG TPA: hypothetical protein HA356_08535, partial [Candidatus Poseidoniaceae archaeon]